MYLVMRNDNGGGKKDIEQGKASSWKCNSVSNYVITDQINFS